MKVVWFTNSVPPAVCQRLGRSQSTSGPWMWALLEALRSRPEVQVHVLAISRAVPTMTFEQDGVGYRIIGVGRRVFHWHPSNEGLDRCAEAVREIKPQLAHVHGTELCYGLLGARLMVQPPVVISIQGLIGVCAPHMWGRLGVIGALSATSLTEVVRGGGLLWRPRQYRLAGGREREIIRGNRFFLGRTGWDHAHVWSINPAAIMHRVGEVLRRPFHELRWELNRCRRHSVIFTNAASPHKGVETLVESLGILQREFPDLRLRLAGSLTGRYGHFVRARIRRMNMERNVEYLGYIDAETMAQELAESHVFVSASHIDNSPNSLAEAQVVGLPCVASYAGGIPSMVEDGQTGLLFPVGDAAMLAHRIRQVFLDDRLAAGLGASARQEALRRHDPETVVNQLLSAYEAVLRRQTSRSGLDA